MDINRLAIAGDWHGATFQARRALRAAHADGAELVLHTGDFGIWPGIGGDRYLAELGDVLDELNLDLWFVDGNHECHDHLDNLPIDSVTGRRPVTDRITHLPRGYRHIFGDHTWLFLGGAASVDRAWRMPGRDWWWQELITDVDVERCIAGGPADVMVCHDAPYSAPTLRKAYSGQYAGAGSWPVADLELSDANQRRVELVMHETETKHLFHGHHHRRYSEQLTGGLWVHGLAHEEALTKNTVLVDVHGDLAPQTLRLL